MAIGVGYEQFWDLTMHDLNIYVDAHNVKRQIEDERDWILGAYVQSAFASVLSKAFGSKGSKGIEYAGEPYLAKHFGRAKKKLRLAK